MSDAPTHPSALAAIALDTICHNILKAREFDAAQRRRAFARDVAGTSSSRLRLSCRSSMRR